MAKKGNRPNKANQTRTREEQWRRRAAAQGGGATSVVDPDVADQDGAGSPDIAEFTAVELPVNNVPAPRPTTAQARTSTSSASAVSQRRTATTARQTRNRYAPQGMSIEDEMYYVRADIRRLILLTAACVAVLIVLYFLLPK